MQVRRRRRDRPIRDAHPRPVRRPQLGVGSLHTDRVSHEPQLREVDAAQVAVAEQGAGEVEEDGRKLG